MDWFATAEQEWEDAVLRWKQAVDDYKIAIQAHYDNKYKAEAIGPEEVDAWQSELEKALKIQTAIEMLQESLAATSAWASRTLGLSGMRALGVAFLVPVAVIVGSISAVTAITYALYSYNSELDRKWAYIQSRPDLSPSEVRNILTAETLGITGNIGNVANLALWIVIGGLLLKFGPQLLGKKQ